MRYKEKGEVFVRVMYLSDEPHCNDINLILRVNIKEFLELIFSIFLCDRRSAIQEGSNYSLN